MTTFALKIIALILMTLDHVGLYFDGAPLWLRWLGRASYPLFLFCMVWGYHYTKNRKAFLLRLYLMSLFMTALNIAVDHFFPVDNDLGYGNHNIFLPMLLVGVIISAIELFQKDRKKGGMLLGGIFVVQLLYMILPGLIPALRQLNGDLLTGIIPNLALNEYGFEFVALGVLMYFLREKRELFCVMYILFCIYQFSALVFDMDMSMQWMMIAALPLMLRYNNKRGPSMKYFFYIYYPAHAFVLLYVANFVFANK